MSIVNHPNINAAGFAAAVVVSLSKYLRGQAAEDKTASFDLLHDKIIQFVTEVSEDLDKRFP